MGEKAKLTFGDKELELDSVTGTEGDIGVDISHLRAEAGLITYDIGFGNSAGTKSAVSYVNGEGGELRYRGYSIEDLAEHSTFLEVAYLLFYGDLPDATQLEEWRNKVLGHTLINEEMKKFFDAFPKDAHPMAILSAATSALSTFYPDYLDPLDPTAVDESAMRLIAKTPTIAAWAYKKSIGQPYVYPQNDLPYTANFLRMMYATPTEPMDIDPVIAKALDVLLILHADHGQNCSTSTVRLVGSSQANLFGSVASGMNALWGPLHGGANQSVIEMLNAILADGGDLEKWIARAKDKDDPFRLWGFGHRVYKNYDPRARILKGYNDEITARLGLDDPLLDLALKLEDVALSDDYFIERKLYPNVDFYSGIMFRALGFPPRMFTVLFSIGRLPGWISQWMEMMGDPSTRIGRPRQIYIGETQRPVVPVDKR
ncbi:MAG: citrate synthase [Acidimicrobiia bacterium]|nr:citrate synthase [Acidimicrobiia bacterium]